MKRLARCWRDFLTPRSVDDASARRESLTRMILALTTCTVGAFFVVFAAARVWWGLYAPSDLLIIAAVAAALLAAVALIHWGKWRWVSHLLPTLFWALASLLTHRMGLYSPAVVFYAPAVLLAGALVGMRAMWAALIVSVIGFAVFGWFGRGDAGVEGYLNVLIAASAPLISVALLQWLWDRTLRQAHQRECAAMERLQAANASLEAEFVERARAQEALAASEARYRAMVNAMPVGLLTAQLQPDGRLVFTSANPAAGRLVGFDPAELVGQTVEESFPALAGTGIFGRARRAAEEGVSWHGAEVAYPRHGETRLYDIVLFQSEPGSAAAAVVDVTERARAQEALAASEARYRAVFESTPVGMLTGELTPDGRMTLTGANPAAVRLIGGDFSLEAQTNIEDAFPALKDAGLFDCARRTAETGESWCALRVANPLRPAEQIFEVSIFQSGPGRVVGVIVDITERERALDELRLLYAAVEQLDEAVVITDTAGMVRYFNPAFERATGFGEEDLGTFGFDGAVIPTEALAPITEALRRGESWSGRFTASKKDFAASFPAAMTASPIHNADGQVTHFAFVGRDITDQLALEDQLRQTQKMEAVGQLAGGVAHDFNNLLQVIQGYTEMARQDLDDDHPIRADLDEVMAASQRATSLVRQLLAFSRRDMVNPTYLNLNEVVAGLLKMLRRLIGEHIALEAEWGGDLAPIYADAGQLEQVIINLCVNARDAMPLPDGGRITIRTGRAHLTPAFAAEHLWARAGDFITLSVSDTGMGIAPEVMEHMFEPFYTTKDKAKGTGLGLAMVYGVVKQHDGLIDVQSQVGQGATFTLYWPEATAPAPAPQAEAPSAAELAQQGRGECILVAEDEELVRHLAEHVLRRAGYRVIAAQDGPEAVRLFTESADEVRLAVLDVVMPGLSGRAVAEQLRARAPKLPILFSSGYDFNMLDEALAPGERTNLVHKPYNPSELLRRVKEALEG